MRGRQAVGTWGKGGMINRLLVVWVRVCVACVLVCSCACVYADSLAALFSFGYGQRQDTGRNRPVQVKEGVQAAPPSGRFVRNACTRGSRAGWLERGGEGAHAGLSSPDAKRQQGGPAKPRRRGREGERDKPAHRFAGKSLRGKKLPADREGTTKREGGPGERQDEITAMAGRAQLGLGI